ncbi:exopolyphosphatase [Epibacterium sp. SM1979]|uniref:Exopolyphosphatase n=2 Tax=Tritonibacter litoralis TaxID=2662264 RepID=A0A843YDW6_9RHOB|nr:exopolyphosphatase [Tritonibacter litoralis]
MYESSEIVADWGGYGQPLFGDPEARALSRVGVVDVGSNSVRMVVFDGAARSPAYFFNEKVMCALGAGLSQTGRLNPKGRERALAAMKRFKLLADGMELPHMTVVATAAVRDAEDGAEFCEEVLRETGLVIHIIDGEEEARLSAQGVLLGWPGAYGLICDIGGSSMELAEIHDNKVGKRVTSHLGPLKLKDIKGGKRGRKAHIRDVVEDLHTQMGPQHDRLFLVGGSWRAIARIDMHRRGYPLTVQHEYRMSVKAVQSTAKFIEKSDLQKLRQDCGISNSRMALVPYAAEVLARLVKVFRPKDIAISSYGIREGLLFEQMPQALRDRDPLIEACRFAEAKEARIPGFGRKLYEFVLPLFPRADDAKKRLIKAACLLHDVTWRAHPDYRAELCFENATRANLGGLRHWERVYLGLALMSRYSNRRPSAQFKALESLLDDKLKREAEILGRAMRFGAMLVIQQDAQIGKLTWHPRKKVLDLRLEKDNAPLFTEVAEARFNGLCSALEATAAVKICR